MTLSKFIFITGGVVSSLGKGIASASLGSLLQEHGYKVKLKKLDPYLNVDPGTMNPSQHGEVFVTDDGAETDLDLGHYERFTNNNSQKTDSISAGRIYMSLIENERRGDYLGQTVQVIPHVTNLIKDFILAPSLEKEIDFTLCEIGGTVGDIEGLPFFEAIRQLKNDLGVDRCMFIHVTLIPYIKASREIKTKPTQHSVKELQSIGIHPDIILCRCDKELPESERKKIALFCNVREDNVITALDVDMIYQAPIMYHNNRLDIEVLKHFNLPSKNITLQNWHNFVEAMTHPEEEVKIAVIAKYTKHDDEYKSLIEALYHGAAANKVKVNIKWLNARTLNVDNYIEKLGEMHAILVPGGFGKEGTEGKILAARYAREQNIPYFGICLGMQIAMIEMARNLLGIADATSTEFSSNGTPIIALMTQWMEQQELKKYEENLIGGTMRLGSFPCSLLPNSRVHDIYNTDIIHERHRHRYEFNINFKSNFEHHGVIFSGMSSDNYLTEIIERSDHPWFVAVQFHPELKSRPLEIHPLFSSFLAAAQQYKHIER